MSTHRHRHHCWDVGWEALLVLLLAVALALLWWQWPAVSVNKRIVVPARSVVPERPFVALVEVGGGVGRVWKSALGKAVQAQTGMDVRWLSPRQMPAGAWHESYKRYRAADLCRYLSTWRPRRARWIVGVTKHDISARQPGFLDHAVFGLADVGGAAAIMSVHRLAFVGRRQAGRYTRSTLLRLWRLLIVHEVGHLRGLRHCLTPSCPMSDAGASMPKLLEMQPQLCLQCQRRARSL